MEPAIEIDLEPVESVVVLTLMDNVTDNLMVDQEPARRADPMRSPWRRLAMMAGGRVPDGLIAEHGRGRQDHGVRTRLSAAAGVARRALAARPARARRPGAHRQGA
jgi:hypothetical protein